MASFAPDIEMVNPEYAIESGVRRGLDSMREGLQNLYEQFNYESLEILEIDEGPERACSWSRGSGRPAEPAACRSTRPSRTSSACATGRW